MRIIHFWGGRRWPGAKASMALLTLSMSASMGCFNSRSNSGLWASNHSLRLFRLRLRRNLRPASRKYGVPAACEKEEIVILKTIRYGLVGTGFSPYINPGELAGL